MSWCGFTTLVPHLTCTGAPRKLSLITQPVKSLPSSTVPRVGSSTPYRSTMHHKSICSHFPSEGKGYLRETCYRVFTKLSTHVLYCTLTYCTPNVFLSDRKYLALATRTVIRYEGWVAPLDTADCWRELDQIQYIPHSSPDCTEDTMGRLVFVLTLKRGIRSPFALL